MELAVMCNALDCGERATRHHRYRRVIKVERRGPRGGRRFEWAAEGDWIDADYCETHSQVCSADPVVDPPWRAKMLAFPSKAR